MSYKCSRLIWNPQTIIISCKEIVTLPPFNRFGRPTRPFYLSLGCCHLWIAHIGILFLARLYSKRTRLTAETSFLKPHTHTHQSSKTHGVWTLMIPFFLIDLSPPPSYHFEFGANEMTWFNFWYEVWIFWKIMLTLLLLLVSIFFYFSFFFGKKCLVVVTVDLVEVDVNDGITFLGKICSCWTVEWRQEMYDDWHTFWIVNWNK